MSYFHYQYTLFIALFFLPVPFQACISMKTKLLLPGYSIFCVLAFINYKSKYTTPSCTNVPHGELAQLFEK